MLGPSSPKTYDRRPDAVLAALPVVLEPTASAEELQALGGIVGLVGMVNYFLRPVYLLLYSLVQAVQGRGRKSADR